jgi:molecular chaperone GrpE
LSRKRHNGADKAGPTATEEPEPSPAPASDHDDSEAGLAPVEGPAVQAAELEALRRERDDLRDQLLRRRADFDNYRRRVERDRQQAGFEVAAGIFRELVATVDNLERALQSGATEDALRTGVELTYRELRAFLESQGVVTHDPTGQRFDPEIHQALMHDAVPGVAEGTVAEVFRKGYSYKERLLRPALVKVAKGAESGDGPGGDGGIH